MEGVSFELSYVINIFSRCSLHLHTAADTHAVLIGASVFFLCRYAITAAQTTAIGGLYTEERMKCVSKPQEVIRAAWWGGNEVRKKR